MLSKLSTISYPGVQLYGGEVDEDRRKYRYPGTSTQEVKWANIPLDTSCTTAPELIQFLREILCVSVSDDALFPLREYCCNELTSVPYSSDSLSETTDTHPYSFDSLSETCEHRDEDASSSTSNSEMLQVAVKHPLLVLIFKDSQLLYLLLKLLNSISSTVLDNKVTKESSGKVNFVQNLFRNFLQFLVNHCDDYSCFFHPILQVLGATSAKQNISKPFMSLVGRLTSDFVKEGDPEQLLKFIREGGGQLILECLVMSCKQHTTLFGGSFLGQNVNKIGQKENIKPFSDSTHLVNFLPLASIRAVPGRNSAMELVNSGPSRSSTFHHIFLANERWIELHISLPYPILLHAVQLYQPIGLLQNGPSSVLVKVSSQGALSSALPVTPLIPTSGLSSIKIEFQHPPTAQEVVLHLQRPFVTNSLSLSHVYLLGVGYGSPAGVVGSKVSGASSSARSPAKTEGEHPRCVCVCVCVGVRARVCGIGVSEICNNKCMYVCMYSSLSSIP